MGLSTLISAIEYLEYMEQLERGGGGGRQSTGDVETSGPPPNPLQYRRVDSTFSGSTVIEQGDEGRRDPLLLHQEDPIEEVPKKEVEPKKIRCSKTGALTAGMLARRRRMHNILEKSRRAQMRGCLNVLKEMLPVPTSHSGTPYGRILTTSNTLVNSVKYIRELEEEGGKFEGEVKRLQEIKKEMEGILAQLNGEGGDGGDLEVPPEVEINSAAAVAPIQKELPSRRSSLDISPVLGVTVEEAVEVTIKPEIPVAKLKGAGAPTPILCDLLSNPPLSPLPSHHCHLSSEGGSSHGYFYNDPIPCPPSPFPPPVVQFLFVDRFYNMLPFCSLSGGGGGGGGGAAAYSPPPFEYFTQGLSSGGDGGGGVGYFSNGGGVGGGHCQNTNRFFK